LTLCRAIARGLLFALFHAQGVSGFNPYEMLLALVGAIAVLVIYHVIFGRTARPLVPLNVGSRRLECGAKPALPRRLNMIVDES
jgi:hypothetical protein